MLARDRRVLDKGPGLVVGPARFNRARGVLAPMARRPTSAYLRISSRKDIVMTADDKTRTELEAAVFRRLVEHLRAHTEVQNIDLMILAGCGRTCTPTWRKKAPTAAGA